MKKFFVSVLVVMSVFAFSGCMHEHTMSPWIVDLAPTCNSNGDRHIECESCGEIIFKEAIDAIEHKESEWIVISDSGNEKEDFRYKECIECKVVLQEEQTPLMTPEELANYVQQRTVSVLIDGEAVGSGFFIDEHGTFVTNFHVIDSVFYCDDPKIDIELSSGAKYSVEYILKFDPAYDLAVLKINIKDNIIPYFEINKSNALTGSRSYACGVALGIVAGNFTTGIISSSSHKYGLTDAYISTAAISGGNSGGPLVNERGEVIGVNAAHYIYGESMNVAIKAKNIDFVRYSDKKTLSEFIEWHNLETRNSLNMYIIDIDTADYTTYYYNTYIHTYHDVTGATCKYSSNSDYASMGKTGYDNMYYNYVYEYKKDEIVKYTEYLKKEGYVYREDFSGEDNGSYYDTYYNEVDFSFVQIAEFKSNGKRLVQISMVTFE